ncbi:hypothetical protein HanXRQr2_Chr07g0279501 [Helianthus annuus]|uniref:Uncharacterized protein n=1 Tax=Helianthus annuus TaxID=4232 RepID=A0A9K3IIS3_HELAN|nr:hypothetical protein HanXRQr2_Chr07g0279501 [Helianthus annuus]
MIGIMCLCMSLYICATTGSEDRLVILGYVSTRVCVCIKLKKCPDMLSYDKRAMVYGV